jgi:hypothetical protein
MTRLVSAVPLVAEQTGRAVVLIGGLAVMCRLPTPHRATTDLDTVDRRATGEPSQLQLLLAAGAVPSGPTGAVVRTPYGEVQVDVLGITDADVDRPPDDPTHRLEVLSHAWAASTASHLVLDVQDLAPLTVRVAEPGPLVAMKLQSVMNRPTAKEGTDLLDIVRLALDGNCGPVVFAQLERADPQLRADALLHVRRWFDQYAARSLSRIRTLPEGREVEADDLRLVGDVLAAALST